MRSGNQTLRSWRGLFPAHNCSYIFAISGPLIVVVMTVSGWEYIFFSQFFCHFIRATKAHYRPNPLVMPSHSAFPCVLVRRPTFKWLQTRSPRELSRPIRYFAKFIRMSDTAFSAPSRDLMNGRSTTRVRSIDGAVIPRTNENRGDLRSCCQSEPKRPSQNQVLFYGYFPRYLSQQLQTQIITLNVLSFFPVNSTNGSLILFSRLRPLVSS